ncbi:MAG: nucleoside triphosphate pyrophosphohydrolase [Desulfobacterales bacterium]
MENSKIKSARNSLKELVALVESLRGEDGCPWDQKQTPRTMLVYLLEEIYELADAIESEHTGAVKEELGDVLFHIVFIAHLFQEKGDFSIDDVACDITAKMIRRHPHVFGAANVRNTEEIRQNWHKIKQTEKKQVAHKSIIDSVPRNMPALMRAYQLVERTARSGFDRKNRESLLTELESEFDQLKRAVENNATGRLLDDFGNFMFSLVNLAQLLKIHPETALSKAVKIFEKRFRKITEEDPRL